MRITDLPANVRDKVIEGPSGCWLWQGSRTSAGYGDMRVAGQHWLVHRFIYTVFHGEIPASCVILHKCDTPRCCHPEHLLLGTHQSNQLDKEMKGRGNAGQQNGMSKLTRADVEYIRAQAITGVSQSDLAREFNVNRSCIWKIVHGIHWRN